MALSRRIRFEILRRDGHTCRYCGAAAPEVKLTVDHVIPIALGGGDEPTNLVTACQDCNAGKSSTAPDQAIVEDVDATAMLFAKAVEVAIDRRRKQLADIQLVIDWFWKDVWHDKSCLPPDWTISLGRFYAAGVQFESLVTFADLAATRADPWKYFCGCCWKEIGNLQEDARRLIEDGEV